MKTTFTTDSTQAITGRLREANTAMNILYPGDSPARQPVHTVYGGAQIFKSDTAKKLGATALRTMQEYAPNAAAFRKAIGVEKGLFDEKVLYRRVIDKLKSEPVEDFRIDFEDGYGNRPDTEEDGHAAFTAREVAAGMSEGALPPFIGIRLKPFTEELKTRSIRTLDIFVSTLLEKSGGKLPRNFAVTLPKITDPEQVSALVNLFEILEAKNNLPGGSLRLELMVETPQSIINHQGECSLPAFVAAAQGRCIAAHFGVYDYTASMNITAAYQAMDHPACDFARHMMKVSLAGTGVWLSDGATNVMPVGPHKGKRLSPKQLRENAHVVHRAWQLGLGHTMHSLRNGYYQGWDLHPAQLPIRYAAVYSFFLQGLEAASLRLKTFVEKAAQATLIGDVFDDAATGQGLLNFFLRGISCGAITEKEAQATGLSLEEIRSRSFVKILNMRRSV
ncbi:MAG TPA: phosphoenolpyruvate kinase [Bacteroidota bacterium]|nr:phosphoenolpyruvate kinase [Bacteroidota bacterium]